VLAQVGDHPRRIIAALADRAVDADNVRIPLVDDRVHRYGGLARLPVADDKLALTAADRDESIHCL